MGFLIRPWEQDCRVDVDLPAEWQLQGYKGGEVNYSPTVLACGGKIWFFWQPPDAQARWGWYDPGAQVFSPPYLARIGNLHWEPYSYFYGGAWRWCRWGDKYLVLLTASGPSAAGHGQGPATFWPDGTATFNPQPYYRSGHYGDDGDGGMLYLTGPEILYDGDDNKIGEGIYGWTPDGSIRIAWEQDNIYNSYPQYSSMWDTAKFHGGIYLDFYRRLLDHAPVNRDDMINNDLGELGVDVPVTWTSPQNNGGTEWWREERASQLGFPWYDLAGC